MPHEDDDEGAVIPRVYKLSFPVFDGKEGPLGWLNRCEHFFRAQSTRKVVKVWLASFRMMGAAQHWNYMHERDADVIPWYTFKALCHQRFGPAVRIHDLAELTRLPFRGTVGEYQEAFLTKMAHVGYLSPDQQVRLFTGVLPDAIREDVELQAPQDLQHAMALAQAYEQRASALANIASGGRCHGRRPVHIRTSAQHRRQPLQVLLPHHRPNPLIRSRHLR